MVSNKVTVVLEQQGNQYKLFKIIFHKDGSYFITAPYHKENQAVVFKAKLNYKNEIQQINHEKIISPMLLDDPDRLLKLSHHPDGFLQFSGPGITSGKNDKGEPKGIGIQSWKLSNPPHGPAFGVTIKGFDNLIENKGLNKETLVIESNEIPLDDENDSLIIEGHYIPRPFERYIFVKNKKEFISLTHPAGINMMLFVVRPKNANISKGFFGLRVEGCNLTFGDNNHGYIFSSSTGDVKVDEEGRLLEGTGLFATYPKVDFIKNSPTMNWEND